MVQSPPTLTQFIIAHGRTYPGATGDFTALMNAVALAAKMISREVNKAGLVDILGATGGVNVQGELVQKLDVLAHDAMVDALGPTGLVCVMGSEEAEDPVPVPENCADGSYAVLFDPLDGSSNIDVGAPIGTIFSIRRRVTLSGPGVLEDLVQPGRNQVAAGYVLYGSSTMFVYTTGHGVHHFTLDPSLGEFLLTTDLLTYPETTHIYSANEGNAVGWSEADRRWVEHLKETDSATGRPYSTRYIGALVADFHRNLIQGGVFAYPADTKNRNGKLRLLYEAAPMAFLAEQAGGAASDGVMRVLDIEPVGLHQRTPLYIGSSAEIERVERFHQEFTGSVPAAPGDD